MAKKLLIETRSFIPIAKPALVESSIGKGKVLRVTGVVQNYLEENANGRVYPKELWENLFQKDSDFSRRLESRAMTGVLEHPEDGLTRIAEISHVMTEVRFATDKEIRESKKLYEANDPRRLSEGDILGTYEVVPTPSGDIIRGLHEANVQVGVSSRGLGSVIMEGGKEIVQKDYVCETWDVVYSPSVTRAIPVPMLAEDETDTADDPDIDEFLEEQKRSLAANEITSKEFISIVGNKLSEQTQVSSVSKCAVALAELNETQEVTPKSIPPVSNGGSSKPTPSPKQTKPTPSIMENKLQEMKALRARVASFARTDTSGLKPTEVAAIVEQADDLRYEVDTLVSEDPRVKTLGESVIGSIDTFLGKLDENDAPPAAPKDPAPPMEPEAEDDDVDVSAEVKATLDKAASLLRDNCGEDPECAEVADELEDLAVAVDPSDCCDEFELEESTIKALPVEERKKVRKLHSSHAALMKQHERLSNVTSKLLGQHKKLKEDNTAAQMATKYNTDMIAMGTAVLQKSRPEIYEANKKELSECTTYKAFEEKACSLIEEAKTAKPKGVRAKVNERRKQTLRNRRKPSRPITESNPKKKPLDEGVHPAVKMVSGRRK